MKQLLAEVFGFLSGDLSERAERYRHHKEIQELAREYGFETSLVAMKNTHHVKKTALLIERNLDWLGE